MSLLRKSDFPTLFNTDVSDFFSPMSVFDSPVWRSQIPAVNIKETDDQYTLEVVAPGYKKEDFNVEMNEGRLTIEAESKTSTNEERDNYTRKEYSVNSFSRSFNLPQGIEEKDIKANYKEGILNIALQKTAEMKSSKPKAIAIN